MLKNMNDRRRIRNCTAKALFKLFVKFGINLQEAILL